MPAPSVTLRLDNPSEPPITIALGPNFQAEAMRWSYIARNRDRWTSGTDPGQGDSGPLQAYLTTQQLQKIADARLIEVGIPASAREAEDWPLRVFPWEYALSAATRGLRSRPLTVIRHQQTERAKATEAVRLNNARSIESAPGRLSQYYDTAAEGNLMLSSMGLETSSERHLCNPTRTVLEYWVRAKAPSVIHLAGVDSHQAVSLLGLEAEHPARSLHDGYALKSPTDTDVIDLVEAEDLAGLLCGGEPKPDLVVCNLYNSASRIAARCVALGAKFAVGYHDVIEDGLAMIFCSALYQRLAETQGDMLEAFEAAVAALRRQPGSLRGACIVLWSSVSLIEAKHAPKKPPRRTASPSSRARTLADIAPRDRIRVERSPKPQVNYSLLHNKQSPFRSLQVFRNNVEGAIRDIRVTVDLNAGEGSFPFSMSFDLAEGESGRDLTSEIVLPLTSALIRTQSEPIQSSLRLHVTCEGQTVKEETFRVGLAPVDEWQDGEKDEWRWLPSFVLPRDPAVSRIIDSAQGILCALADDPTAGFDGYQSLGQGRTEAERFGNVDKQVQAIWYAVLNAHGVSYINPPPSYGNYTQRLRTPSQLLAERRGTCIDLALLLAACLEYVDIYPVIFLLTGHAFTGYWRSDGMHSEFLDMHGLELVFGANGPDGDTVNSGGSSAINNPGYVLGQSQHQEVRQRVYQRHLIPLEATWLTNRGGFESAATEGKNNLRRVSEFAAMIDVRLARDRGVTPLPLLGAKG
ncbi:hypothetical protein [Piscinibacter terrae]|uniref:Transglutaminase-like domain-containing protein n=1 Tax=Piscinibacter terrae TaxID=2496871 RepID=A0A3N7J4N9_9BURK|nr:hypothetical protein [Albitalea terrae]RQP25802.1 hypothetical protein DZC73_01675 [Albitalea terrae]